jgi:hypothetical protein
MNEKLLDSILTSLEEATDRVEKILPKTSLAREGSKQKRKPIVKHSTSKAIRKGDLLFTNGDVVYRALEDAEATTYQQFKVLNLNTLEVQPFYTFQYSGVGSSLRRLAVEYIVGE